MKYLQPSFSVGGANSKEFDANYDETFGKQESNYCNCGHAPTWHKTVWENFIAKPVCEICDCGHSNLENDSKYCSRCGCCNYHGPASELCRLCEHNDYVKGKVGG